MQAECPHCQRPISIVGAKELRDEFGLSANSVQHARERGTFPSPWLTLENRMLYTREQIDHYLEERSKITVERAVEDLLSSYDRLPPDEQALAREALEKRLALPSATRRKKGAST